MLKIIKDTWSCIRRMKSVDIGSKAAHVFLFIRQGKSNRIRAAGIGLPTTQGRIGVKYFYYQ